MKRMKLRMWVKVVLGVALMIGLIAFNNSYTNKTIEQCVNAGNDRTYCENGLR